MVILLVEPGKAPRRAEIDGSLQSMQELVGGTIQAIYPFEEPVALICNDEGKMIGLPLNRCLRNENGKIYDIIAGTFFLCNAPADSENFESLSERQVSYYMTQFRCAEIYLT